MSYPELWEPECADCGSYHCKLICEDCAKEQFGNKEESEVRE